MQKSNNAAAGILALDGTGSCNGRGTFFWYLREFEKYYSNQNSYGL